MRKLMDAGFAAPAGGSGSMLLSALRGAPRSLVPYVIANGTCAVAPRAGPEMMARGELPSWGLVIGSLCSRNAARDRSTQNRTENGEGERVGTLHYPPRDYTAPHNKP